MADQWYVGKGGKKHGPFTNDQLKKLAADGKIDRTDLLWKEGMEKWVPCSSAKGLFSAVAAAPLSPSPPPPAFDNPLAAPDSNNPTDAFAGFEMPAYAPTPEAPPAKPAEPQPPAISPAKPARRLDYAGFGSRVGAFFIDGFVLLIPLLGISFGFMPPVAELQDKDKLATAILGIQFFGTLFNIAYGAVMESSNSGGTFGKRAVGIRVADLQGRQIGMGRALVRNIVKPFSSFLAIGLILALVTPRKQALHDLAAGTVVVKA